MHAVTAILLRLPCSMVSGRMPSLHQAHEPSEAWKRRACRVGADDGGNAELTEDLDEYGLGELDRRGVQPSALESSAETVLDGKGIAVAAVEHLEWPLKSTVQTDARPWG